MKTDRFVTIDNKKYQIIEQKGNWAKVFDISNEDILWINIGNRKISE